MMLTITFLLIGASCRQGSSRLEWNGLLQDFSENTYMDVIYVSMIVSPRGHEELVTHFPAVATELPIKMATFQSNAIVVGTS
jgi:hypothetical protein